MFNVQIFADTLLKASPCNIFNIQYEMFPMFYIQICLIPPVIYLKSVLNMLFSSLSFLLADLKVYMGRAQRAFLDPHFLSS